MEDGGAGEVRVYGGAEGEGGFAGRTLLEEQFVRHGYTLI